MVYVLELHGLSQPVKRETLDKTSASARTRTSGKQKDAKNLLMSKNIAHQTQTQGTRKESPDQDRMKVQ